MTDFKKIVDVMCWETFDDETPEQVFARNGNFLNSLPSSTVVDIVHAGGILKWAESQNVKSKKQLYDKIIFAARRTISDPVFQDKKRIDTFPPFANFFFYCQKIDRNGKLAQTAEDISDAAWLTVCRRNLAENLNKMFSVAPDKQRFEAVKAKIMQIWDFTEKDVDAIRYFVCQTRHENHNPSLNKSLYFWGHEKQTGKTTIARALITILNGDEFDNFGTYESNFGKEMQFNDHDLPLSALYNAVLMDEAMPKDSRKSYGTFKQVLTSNSCYYNQKFMSIKHISCKRFYIFTSNTDVSEYIQDEKERRLYPKDFVKKPDFLTFDEIYKIWLEFAVNCEPEDDWKKWYDSFELVNGIEHINIKEVISELILNKESIFGSLQGTYTTVKRVASSIFKNEPNPDQRRIVTKAMERIFKGCKPDSNDSYYSIPKCRERLSEMNIEDALKGFEDLPF